MMFLRIRFGFAVTSSTVGCPLQTFILFVLPLFISMAFVLASIDRFFVSLPAVRAHNMNQVRVARQITVITALLCIMYVIPFLFIYYFDGKVNQCLTYSSTIALIYLSSRIVISYIVIPLVMAIFGLLTIRNIQNQTRRIAPIFINPQQHYRRRRNEAQLSRMLILQISAYLVFSVPAGVAYTLVTFIPSMNTSFMVQLRIIFSLWQHTIYFLSFFLYVLSSKTYRKEFLHMFKLNNFKDRLPRPVVQFIARHVPTINTIDNRV